jgi:saccharopepsin
MKGTTFLATAMAAGTASAGIHKMSLKKVPLSEQLVSFIA